MFFAGVDIAKQQHEVCVLDPEGKQVLAMPIPNRQAAAERFVRVLQGQCGEAPENVLFCMEATGHYWLALYGFLTRHGYQVHVVNPIQSDAARDLYIRKSKTDRKDAFILADLLRMNKTEKTLLASESVLKLQTLSRTRFAFMDQVAALKQRVLGILDRIFPEYPDCFSDVFIKSSRELLKNYSTPDEMATADLTELAQFLAVHSHGRLGRNRAQELQQYAKGTFGISIAVDAFALELKLLLAQIEFIEEQVQALEGAILLALEEYRAECPSDGLPIDCHHVIETIPGIGPVLTAAIIGEVGDIGRFSNARKLVAYSGLDATTRESGQFVGTRNHLSKRGSPYLRRALWLAAISARRYNPELRAYYEEKKAQGKHSMVATGAVARRLVHMIYSVWNQNRPFDPNYHWAPPGSSDNN